MLGYLGANNISRSTRIGIVEFVSEQSSPEISKQIITLLDE